MKGYISCKSFSNKQTLVILVVKPTSSTLLLIKQEKLHFQDDKSDKVYEVELFHVQDDDYIVNFRYGRRGRKLTEGTKTVFPVSKVQGEKVFADLVSSKTKKGYRSVTEYEDLVEQIIEVIDVEESGAKPVVLSYLKTSASGGLLTTNWKLSRIIWRAGELHIEEAVPQVHSMMPSLQGQEVYSAIWMMGRIANADCLKYLKSYSVTSNDLYRHIYTGALLNAGDKSTHQEIIGRLPITLKTSYLASKHESFFKTIREYLFELKTQDSSYLQDVYYLSIQDKSLREPLAEILRDVPYQPGIWKYLRYIYKISEMVEDGVAFGMIASRVNMNRPFFTAPVYGDSIYLGNARVNVKENLAKEDAQLAFSNKTRNYFIRRTLRRLKKSGYDKQESYCAFASGILTAYNSSDERVHPPTSTYTYDSAAQRYNRQNMEFPSMAHAPYLYYIMYARGTRLHMSNGGKYHYEGTAVEQREREDSFPQLWNKYPKHVVSILVKCRVKEVMHFAFSILKGRTDLDSLFSLADIKLLVKHPLPEALEFSLDLIRRKYDSNNPDLDLIVALVESNNSKAIDLALELINQNSKPFLKHIPFIKIGIITPHENIHLWLRKNIKESNLSEADAKEIVESTIEQYLSAEEGEIDSISADTLILIFENHLSQIDDETILRMLDIPNIQIQLFAAKLINISKKEPTDWPDSVLLKLLNSEHPELRQEGMTLFSKLTDEELLQKTAFIARLAASEHADLRISSRTIIARLAPIDKVFGESVFRSLYTVLLDKHEDEELPLDVYTTIEDHLLEHTTTFSTEDLDELLKSDKREIHLLTHHFLKKYAKLDNWPVERVALMGNHDMKDIRQLAYNFYSENVDKMKFHKYEAIRILDSDWEETRAFGRAFFDEHFDEKTWEAGLIVALCDSIRPETQDYGTRILGQYFREENGIHYLSTLSEHPDPTIQLYTTNYLNKYAFNNMDLLQHLKPYFKRILSTINTRRAAKLRVVHFLEKQANEGEAQARYVAEILNEVLGTIAVRENESYVTMLYDIHNKHPEIKTDIEIVPLEIRS